MEELIAWQSPEAQSIIRLLLARTAELEERLRLSPRNSSRPPSTVHPHRRLMARSIVICPANQGRVSRAQGVFGENCQGLAAVKAAKAEERMLSRPRQPRRGDVVATRRPALHLVARYLRNVS
jgi:hypothetical protein